MMKNHGFTANNVIAWLRIVRPGAKLAYSLLTDGFVTSYFGLCITQAVSLVRSSNTSRYILPVLFPSFAELLPVYATSVTEHLAREKQNAGLRGTGVAWQQLR